MKRTSLMAYRQIKDGELLKDLQFKIYDFLLFEGPHSASEVDLGIESRHAHKQMTSLERKGIVRRDGLGKCSTSGREVQIWEAVEGGLHRNPPPRKTKLKIAEIRIKELEKVNERLRRAIKKLN